MAGMGMLLMLAGLSLFLWNRREASAAADRAAAALSQIKAAMEKGALLSENAGVEIADEGMIRVGEDGVLTVTVDSYEYAGYISVPALAMELPVMAQWSYPRLRIAPCRYYGSAEEKNLVIAAHNYPRHFGRISELDKGGEVLYTDMEGTVWRYEVEAVDVLAPEAVEEMTDAGYALTLFTCTYGGAGRVTVRCAAVE